MKAETTALQVGFSASISLAAITLITFAFALTAIPISGAFCPEGCIDYPYLDTLSQFPGDYLWMFPAIILLLTYLIFSISIHHFAAVERKIFSQIGVGFAFIATTVLLLDYFLQFSVIPASLKSGETEGIPLLTQYNPHGIFIAMEELGYLMMSASFLFLGAAFSGRSRLESAVKWTFFLAFALALLSFLAISIQYGIVRKDRFEVFVISIDWLALIINGILLSILFRRKKKEHRALMRHE